MSALDIKSTESFKKANKKTIAVALDNLTTPINNRIIRHPLVDEQKIIDTIYGDIPDKYRFKQQSKEEREL